VDSKRSAVILTVLVALVACASVPAQADPIAIGLLSFDNILAPTTTGPGVNAFDLSNLTGPYGLFDLSASDSLTFLNAVLTLNPGGGAASTTMDLGDVLPGPLTDSNGNPLVTFPTDDSFVSATFTADLTPDLAPLSFHLSDGSIFDAASPISVSLTLSQGESDLMPGDFAVIYADPAPVTPVPEPASGTLLATGMIGCFCLLRMRSIRENRPLLRGRTAP
jgi:hypothetical protein